MKHVDDIEEIWVRLKKAFGDARIMISRTFGEISSFEVLLRSRDLEKITTGLSKIINTMKDLENLSKQHKIEQKLYHGDGLQRIYKLIGEGRITRWLSQNDDVELDEEASWKSLMNFLKKEIRIQQQRQMILGKLDSSPSQEKNGSKEKIDDRKTRSGFYVRDTRKDEDNADTNLENLCHICGEEGHVATVGPGDSKLIQYFT